MDVRKRHSKIKNYNNCIKIKKLGLMSEFEFELSKDFPFFLIGSQPKQQQNQYYGNQNNFNPNIMNPNFNPNMNMNLNPIMNQNANNFYNINENRNPIVQIMNGNSNYTNSYNPNNIPNENNNKNSNNNNNNNNNKISNNPKENINLASFFEFLYFFFKNFHKSKKRMWVDFNSIC